MKKSVANKASEVTFQPLAAKADEDNDGVESTGAGIKASGIQKAEEDAKIAEANARKARADNEAKLQEQGYKTLQDALVDAERKKAEVDKILGELQQQRVEIENKMQAHLKDIESLNEEKDKVIAAYKVAKGKEAAANVRLEEAAKLEQRQVELCSHNERLKKEIQILIGKYNADVRPCLKVLRKCVSVIDDIRVLLRYPNKYERESLFNYMFSRGRYLGKLVDRIDAFIDTVESE